MVFCQDCGSKIYGTGNFCSNCGAKQTGHKEIEHHKSSKTGFVSIISIIGAILIFVGIAWLIAKNWHQIPDIGKVSILVFSTLLCFIIGVFLRQSDHEVTGRALITLGGLLYILSVFLIAQIYATPTGLQGYAWLLLLCWPIIYMVAYFLDSPENLVLSLIVFFPWAIIQYISSILKYNSSPEQEIVLGFILLFLSAGSLLYGLSALHNSLKHKFTKIYRIWTVFYFLLIFYILSFQSILPLLSEYSFEGGMFSIFLVSFIVLCFFGFIIGTLFAVSKSAISFKEIIGFIAVLGVLFVLILATKTGAGLVGSCNPKNCYDFETIEDCNSVSDFLICGWETNEMNEDGFCESVDCFNFETESECKSALPELECSWEDNIRCMPVGREIMPKGLDNHYQTCNPYHNQKSECLNQEECQWDSRSFNISEGLPTNLWLLWIIINFVFLGFIISILGYGQLIGSTKIVNLGLLFFVIDIITRYIGFWIDLRGYFAFSILAIFGGILLIVGSWLIPKWRRKLLDDTNSARGIE